MLLVMEIKEKKIYVSTSEQGLDIILRNRILLVPGYFEPEQVRSIPHSSTALPYRGYLYLLSIAGVPMIVYLSLDSAVFIGALSMTSSNVPLSMCHF